MAGAAVPRLRWPRKKKKPQHKLTLGRGWRGSIFPKADYSPPPPPLPPPPPPPPPVLPLPTPPPPPLHSLSETSCSLGSCFDNADLRPRGENLECIYVRVCVIGWVDGGGGAGGEGGSPFQEPSTCKSRPPQPRMLKPRETNARHPCPMPEKPQLSEGQTSCWSSFRSTAGPRKVVFFQV